MNGLLVLKVFQLSNGDFIFLRIMPTAAINSVLSTFKVSHSGSGSDKKEKLFQIIRFINKTNHRGDIPAMEKPSGKVAFLASIGPCNNCQIGSQMVKIVKICSQKRSQTIKNCQN